MVNSQVPCDRCGAMYPREDAHVCEFKTDAPPMPRFVMAVGTARQALERKLAQMYHPERIKFLLLGRWPETEEETAMATVNDAHTRRGRMDDVRTSDNQYGGQELQTYVYGGDDPFAHYPQQHAELRRALQTRAREDGGARFEHEWRERDRDPFREASGLIRGYDDLGEWRTSFELFTSLEETSTGSRIYKTNIVAGLDLLVDDVDGEAEVQFAGEHAKLVCDAVLSDVDRVFGAARISGIVRFHVEEPTRRGAKRGGFTKPSAPAQLKPVAWGPCGETSATRSTRALDAAIEHALKHKGDRILLVAPEESIPGLCRAIKEDMQMQGSPLFRLTKNNDLKRGIYAELQLVNESVIVIEDVRSVSKTSAEVRGLDHVYSVDVPVVAEGPLTLKKMYAGEELIYDHAVYGVDWGSMDGSVMCVMYYSASGICLHREYRPGAPTSPGLERAGKGKLFDAGMSAVHVAQALENAGMLCKAKGLHAYSSEVRKLLTEQLSIIAQRERWPSRPSGQKAIFGSLSHAAISSMAERLACHIANSYGRVNIKDDGAPANQLFAATVIKPEDLEKELEVFLKRPPELQPRTSPVSVCERVEFVETEQGSGEFEGYDRASGATWRIFLNSDEKFVTFDHTYETASEAGVTSYAVYAPKETVLLPSLRGCRTMSAVVWMIAGGAREAAPAVAECKASYREIDCAEARTRAAWFEGVDDEPELPGVYAEFDANTHAVTARSIAERIVREEYPEGDCVALSKPNLVTLIKCAIEKAERPIIERSGREIAGEVEDRLRELHESSRRSSRQVARDVSAAFKLAEDVRAGTEFARTPASHVAAASAPQFPPITAVQFDCGVEATLVQQQYLKDCTARGDYDYARDRLMITPQEFADAIYDGMRRVPQGNQFPRNSLTCDVNVEQLQTAYALSIQVTSSRGMGFRMRLDRDLSPKQMMEEALAFCMTHEMEFDEIHTMLTASLHVAHVNEQAKEAHPYNEQSLIDLRVCAAEEVVAIAIRDFWAVPGRMRTADNLSVERILQKVKAGILSLDPARFARKEG